MPGERREAAGRAVPPPPPGSPPAFWLPLPHTPCTGWSPPRPSSQPVVLKQGHLCPRGTPGSTWGSLGFHPGAEGSTGIQWLEARHAALVCVSGALGHPGGSPHCYRLHRKATASERPADILPEGLCLPIRTMGITVPTSRGWEGQTHLNWPHPSQKGFPVARGVGDALWVPLGSPGSWGECVGR